MSEENVEAVRRGYAAFTTEGIEGAIPFYTEDVVIYSIPEWPDDPEYHGHDGVRKLDSAVGGELRRLRDSMFVNSTTEETRW